jgi:hypothetical protein
LLSKFREVIAIVQDGHCFYSVELDSGFNGALTFSPPTFSPSDNSTHTVSPSDNRSAVCLVLVTNSPSPKPKVDVLLVHPKNEYLYPKI